MGLALLLPGLALGIPILLLTAVRPSWWVVITVLCALLGPLASLAPQQQALPLTLFQIALVITLLVTLNAKLLSGSLTLRPSPVFLWMGSFLALLLMSTLYTKARGDALITGLSVVPLAALALVVGDSIKSERVFRWMFELSVAVMLVPSVLSVATFILNPSVSVYNVVAGEVGAYWVTGRQVGSLGDPNHFAILLVFPLIYLLVQLFLPQRTRPGWLVLYHAAAFALIFGALLTTYSRSGWLAFMVAALLVFVWAQRTRRFVLLALAGLAVLALLALSSAFVQSLLSRGLSVFETASSASAAAVSNNSRIILARAGLEMFADSYFFGFGYRSFRELAPLYFDLTKTGGVYAPHNVTIQLLAELGVLGAVAFYGMVGSALAIGLKTLKRSSGEVKTAGLVILGYLAALVCFYQLSPLGINDNLLWVCLGAVPAVKMLADSQ